MKNRKKLFLERIKDYEKKRETMSEYIKKEYIGEDGVATINLNLDNVEPFNPLSLDNQLSINPEIISYIDEKVYPIPAPIPIKILIHGNIDDNNKQKIINKLHEHYNLQLSDKKLDLRINTFRSLALFIIGIILLGIFLWLSSSTVNKMWCEILSIVSTLIIWEAAYSFIIERHELRINYYDAAQLAIANIEFKQTKL